MAVELALALPAVVLLLAAMLAGVRVAAVGTALPAAAVAGARAGAIAGDDAALAAASRVAGAGASVRVDRGGGWVDVTVTLDLGWPWGERVARASLPLEPGVG